MHDDLHGERRVAKSGHNDVLEHVALKNRTRVGNAVPFFVEVIWGKRIHAVASLASGSDDPLTLSVNDDLVVAAVIPPARHRLI